MQIRNKSNLKKKIQVTQQLEKEARTMEDQLVQLRQILSEQKTQVRQPNETRWKAATQNKSIRNYAQNILTQKRLNDQIKKQTIKKIEKPQTPYDTDINNLLNKLGLIQYKEKFVNYTMNQLRGNFCHQIYSRDIISVQLLRDMGILPGHQIKIIKAIKDIQGDLYEESVICQAVQMSQTIDSQLQSVKISCWLCYKIQEEGLFEYNRNFCSSECYTRFQQSFINLCCVCQRTYYKNDGYIIYDKHYCSKQCGDQIDVLNINTNTIESIEEERNNERPQEINYAEEFNEFLTKSLLNE
ncbi:hypothetical protein pb186bvf_008821 [Paramecium bursaria]